MTPLISRVTEDLRAAYRSGAPIAPPTRTHPGLTIADAYAIQLAQVATWTADGAVLVGHKIGLTSAPMRRALGVDEPDYGHLLDTMVVPSGGSVARDRFLQPRVEPEIAFVLARDLDGAGVTAADVIRATDHVLAAIEIIDSRIADWQLTILDTVADNASSGGLVLGTRPRRIDEIDLSTTGAVLTHNGVVVETGAGAAVMSNPINAVVWLVRRLAAAGQGLAAGQVVLSGSFTAAAAVGPGDHADCAFGGLGSVSVRFDSSGDHA